MNSPPNSIDIPKQLKRPYLLGIDPGLSGALAFLDIRTKKIIQVTDMPTLISTTEKNGIEPIALSERIRLYEPMTRFCVLEKVSAMTYQNKQGEIRGQGAAASFNFGKGYGILIGILTTLKIPIVDASPGVWKIIMGLSSSKEASIELAKKLSPEISSSITLKKHDGRAEAILLAHFGLRFIKKEENI
jgi:crossover junction endodeoxyribonuclease RuvC